MSASSRQHQRIPLGRLLKGISTNFFNAEVIKGKIVLEPMKAIPEFEAWLYENPEALNSIKRGIKDAAEGRVVDFDPDKD